MALNRDALPRRPAWIEIDLAQIRRNVRLIRQDLSPDVELLAVVKDDAYGHGALTVANVALAEGAYGLGLITLQEAMELRDAGISCPILMLGQRRPEELEWCVAHHLTVCINETGLIGELARTAERLGRRAPVHVKIHTGMSRYGVRWEEAMPLLTRVLAEKWLQLDGVFTHLAQSDETDKTFARVQIARFGEVLASMDQQGITARWRHVCNSGGFLDLPSAHFDLVRVGILLGGVFPSQACRRIAGIAPVMSVKARIAAIQNLRTGEVAGYGMRYTAPSPRRIAVLPIGYGDGYPRVRNEGAMLIRGRKAPLIGGVAMDSLLVDITEIPEAEMWDEAILMGRQGNQEITAAEIAALKRSVAYDILAGWRSRLPRVVVG